MAVEDEELNLCLDQSPRYEAGRDLGIGAIGAGFIMREVHLAAYADAGYRVVAIASRSRASAEASARIWGIERVHDHWRELLADPNVAIVDSAYPPHLQLEIVRAATTQNDHIRGILLQKPIATNLSEAAEIVRLCDESGIALSVNQNMRYDQSMRALKTLLERGDLGDPVMAQIIMNAPLSWQPFIPGYGRTLLLNMSIHHLDAYRFLFGEPERIIVSVRDDPRQPFEHVDGAGCWVLEYHDGMRAVSIENSYATHDTGISWRVDGRQGMAHGTIGWPNFPAGSPSTIAFRTHRRPGYLFSPEWSERWFPHAFAGTMGQLLEAVALRSEPLLSGRDNLRSMALVEAGYRSVAERRAIEIADISPEEIAR